jgi:phosphatidylserine/phosphatidylglycerophosphate/cardiolipin synthase-like enzyme
MSVVAAEDFFIKPGDGYYRFAPTTDNGVTIFYDNPSFYQAILRDLYATREAFQFLYFAGWWSDLRLPMGDPKASPKPPTLGAVLMALSAGVPVPPPPDQSSVNTDERKYGPEICCMLWQQKSQYDYSAAPAIVLPDSIVGAPILGAINTATVKAVNRLRGFNDGILDKRHALFGSHHQKFTVMLTSDGLVAYVGSSDYNADRLYASGDGDAPSAPAKGSPLNDVNVRLTGPAAVDVLKTFVDRWRAHPDSKDRPLKGETYKVVKTAANQGTVQIQLSHTYTKTYPFPEAVRSAADAQLRICRTALRYVYFEDQYLIGTPELWAALRDKLSSNVEFVVVGVMAPLNVVADLRWLKERRSDFWLPLVAAYPGRVLLFEMLAPDGTDSGPGAYLHNKMTIADDVIVTMGSVNFSRRSHTHDSEIMATLGGPLSPDSKMDIALKVRADRWARHLGTKPGNPPRLEDAIAAFRRLPGTARIRPWTPVASAMSAVERAIYLRAYDIVIDPP